MWMHPNNTARHSPRFAGEREPKERLTMPDAAAFNLAGGLAIAGVIVTALVAVIIISELAPTYGNAVGNLSGAVSTADWGDSTANSLADSVFPLVIALGGLFALVGLAMFAYQKFNT